MHEPRIKSELYGKSFLFTLCLQKVSRNMCDNSSVFEQFTRTKITSGDNGVLEKMKPFDWKNAKFYPLHFSAFRFIRRVKCKDNLVRMPRDIVLENYMMDYDEKNIIHMDYRPELDVPILSADILEKKYSMNKKSIALSIAYI